MHLGEHRVRLGFREEAAALDRRQLRGVAEHQHGTPNESRSRPSSASTIEHSSMMISSAFDGRRLIPKSKLGISSPLSRAR
jgi:hypothetical protein